MDFPDLRSAARSPLAKAPSLPPSLHLIGLLSSSIDPAVAVFSNIVFLL